jgi:hypothetical protein
VLSAQQAAVAEQLPAFVPAVLLGDLQKTHLIYRDLANFKIVYGAMTDFAAWGKFDADAAAEVVDKEVCCTFAAMLGANADLCFQVPQLLPTACCCTAAYCAVG